MRRLPTQLAATVIQARREWIDRSISFDRCSLLKLMASPEDIPTGFPPGLHSLVGRRDSLELSCRARPAVAQEPGLGGFPPRFTFDSVAIIDSLAVVYTTVFRGENIHREDFNATRQHDGNWGLRSVLIHGMVRIH